MVLNIVQYELSHKEEFQLKATRKPTKYPQSITGLSIQLTNR